MEKSCKECPGTLVKGSQRQLRTNPPKTAGATALKRRGYRYRLFRESSRQGELKRIVFVPQGQLKVTRQFTGGPADSNHNRVPDGTPEPSSKPPGEVFEKLGEFALLGG
jgi:hypothetical protein